MSILIKGMDIPDTCMQCVMQIGGWCYVSPPEIDERVAPTVDEAVEQGKPDWCPLVTVPTPHGRIVDIDAVLDGIKNADGGLTCGELIKQTTIIEAEE